MSAHLCITTYKSPKKSTLKLELCFMGKECEKIPAVLGATYGVQTKRLDVSYNVIRSLEGLEYFPFLEELILDNNHLDDSVDFPPLESLQTLSLNKNKFMDLPKLIKNIQRSYPNLRYLSLIGNPVSSHTLMLHDSNERESLQYRCLILSNFPELRFLDSSRVRKRDIEEAKIWKMKNEVK